MNKELGIMNKAAKIFALMGVAIFVAGVGASIAPSAAHAQIATCPNFGLERTIIYDLQDVAYAYGYGVATDSSKNVYVAGEQYAPVTGLDAYLIKYDAAGVMQWGNASIYDAGGNESAYGVAVDSVNNKVYIVGRQTDSSGGNSDIFIRKYNGSDGTLDTAFGTGGTVLYDGGSTDIGRGIALDAAGNVYVAGYKQNAGGDIDMLLISYDANGNVRAGFPPNTSVATTNESAFSITVSGNDVFTAGYVQPAVNNTDMALWKYTTAGALSPGWPKIYNSGGNQTDVGYGVSVSATNDVYVTGYQATNSGNEFLRKYDSAGNFIWTEFYAPTSSQNATGRAITTGNSDRIFVAGRQQTNNEDAFLNEYNKDALSTITSSTSFTSAYSYLTPGTGSVQSGGVSGNAECGGDPASDTQYKCTWTAGAYCQTPYGQNTPAAGNCAGSIPLGQAGSTVWFNGDGGPPTVYPCLPGYVLIGGMCQSTTLVPLTTLLAESLYKGDQGGSPEYAEIGYGIAQTDSSVPMYAGVANDVYVTGYSAESGGQMFLNKYSCNAVSTPTFGASTAANFTVTPSAGTAPLIVKADARATAGNIVKYEWDWNYNGTTFIPSSDKNAVTTHTYTSNGSFVIALRVTDTKGVTDIATASVAVSPNTAPIGEFQTCDRNDANCIASTAGIPFSGVVPLRVNVNGAASSDPDPSGSIVSFSWDWGDKTVDGSGEKTTHTYSADGTYTITLTVTDNGGLANTVAATQVITVTTQYVCAPACSGATPICGPGAIANTTQCYACLADNDCGTGYQCLGTSCAQGTQCPDGTMCPIDGKCAETVSCNPLATGATCPDGSACPANGVCPAIKYSCALSSNAVDTQCYVEEFGGCLVDGDCTVGITGGVCVGSPGVCRYAKCLNTTDFACTNDSECVNGDGTCNAGVCNYVYDCAYGPGMGKGASGLYSTTTADAMPKMPQGVQPDGQACTKPTPDAPNNCEGINGCLYYNYNSNGKPIINSNNSVGTCINTFEGGTGCVYYQYFNGTTQREKVNCLPRYAENTKKPPHAGIPEGCFVMDKGKAGKEYDCSAVDGCYYYLDGRVDCRYKNITDVTCTAATISTDCTAQPNAIATCNASGLCEYQGNGCLYEPNPKGAISCPGVSKAATGGDNFVQCLLNKDAGLPGFLLGASGDALSACKTNSDCPTGTICVNGTCYPQCQANVDCATGEQCTGTCATSLDCAGNLVCVAGVCTPPTSCTPGTICPNGLMCPVSGICPPSPSCIPGTICPNGTLCPVDGVCPATPPSCTPGTICPSGLVCPVDGVCPLPPSCTPGTICPNGMVCPVNGVCPPLPICIPGTICPNGTLCPANGICPPPTSCTPGTICPNGLMCPVSGICPPPPITCSVGTVYNPMNGLCENCSMNPTLSGCPAYLSFCDLNPTSPLCAGGPGSGGGPIPVGISSCNTLGYTFTNTAVTPSGNCDLVAIILALLSWMAWIITLLAVLSGLRAAFLYITAMGNEKNLILAKRYLIYTTIGVAVSVLTFSIVAITRAILNI